LITNVSVVAADCCNPFDASAEPAFVGLEVVEIGILLLLLLS
jgi:predicted component of type VI protein secretion system